MQQMLVIFSQNVFKHVSEGELFVYNYFLERHRKGPRSTSSINTNSLERSREQMSIMPSLNIDNLISMWLYKRRREIKKGAKPTGRDSHQSVTEQLEVGNQGINVSIQILSAPIGDLQVSRSEIYKDLFLKIFLPTFLLLQSTDCVCGFQAECFLQDTEWEDVWTDDQLQSQLQGNFKAAQ